jgi:hypothetical protein
MRRRLLRAAALLLLPGLAAVYLLLLRPMAELGTGYAAKIACSGVFLGGRAPADVLREDLFFVPWVSVEVDRERRSATARTLFTTRTAVHRDGLGSALVLPGGPDEAALRAQALPGPSEETLAALAARPWPLGDAGIDPAAEARAQGVDEAALARALENAFREPDPAAPTIRTRALLVLHEGRIVAERYAPGFGPETRLIGWSMSKSLLHALVGIRVAEGKLSLDAAGLLPAWRGAGDARATITLEELLRMSSGLRFEEKYHLPWADAVRMLFRSPDASAYAAALPLEAAPGGRWSYSSGTSNIVSQVLRASFEEEGGDPAYLRFPRERLFDRIGMRSATVETDPAGTYALSSFSYATARDWARFGLLYLEDGLFAGERVLPAGWAAHAARPTPNVDKGRYGAHFWLNAGPPGEPERRPMPQVPADTYHASGFQDQHVVIVPSRRVVIVRLGITMLPTMIDLGALTSEVLAALPPPKGHP